MSSRKYVPPHLRNPSSTQQRGNGSSLISLSELTETNLANLDHLNNAGSSSMSSSMMFRSSRGASEDDENNSEINSISSYSSLATSKYSVDFTQHGLQRLDERFNSNIKIIQKVLKNINQNIKGIEITKDSRSNIIKVETNGVVAIFNHFLQQQDNNNTNNQNQRRRPRLITAYPSSSNILSNLASFNGIPWDLAMGPSLDDKQLNHHYIYCRYEEKEKEGEELRNHPIPPREISVGSHREISVGSLLDASDIRCAYCYTTNWKSFFDDLKEIFPSLCLNIKSFIHDPLCIFNEENNVFDKISLKKHILMALSIIVSCFDENVNNNNNVGRKSQKVKICSSVSPCLYFKLGTWDWANNDKFRYKQISKKKVLFLHFVPIIPKYFDAVNHCLYPFLRYFCNVETPIEIPPIITDHTPTTNPITDTFPPPPPATSIPTPPTSTPIQTEVANPITQNILSMNDNGAIPLKFRPFVYGTKKEDDSESRQKWYIYHNDGIEGVIVSAYDKFFLDVYKGGSNKIENAQIITWDINRNSKKEYPENHQKWILNSHKQYKHFFTIQTCMIIPIIRKEQVISCDKTGLVRLCKYDENDNNQIWEIISENANDENAYVSKFRNKNGYYLTCGASHAQDSLPRCHPIDTQDVIQKNIHRFQYFNQQLENENNNLINKNKNNKIHKIKTNLVDEINKTLLCYKYRIIMDKNVNPNCIGFIPCQEDIEKTDNRSGAGGGGGGGVNFTLQQHHLYDIDILLNCFLAMQEIAQKLNCDDPISMKSVQCIESDFIDGSFIRLFLTTQRDSNNNKNYKQSAQHPLCMFLNPSVVGILTLPPSFYQAFSQTYR